MKVRDYKFESREELELVAESVLLYNGVIMGDDSKDYYAIYEYKLKQLQKLLPDKYDITPRDLMMYLSCPIGVENSSEISNFGIRTLNFPGNGRINMFLSDKILFYSLDGLGVYQSYVDKIFDDQVDEPDTLVNKDDLLEVYAPSMLEDTSLLYYLFITGRGDEFTRIYGDVTFLNKLEKGEFTEDDIKSRLSKSSEDEELKDKLNKLLETDKYFIEYLENKNELPSKKLK